MGNLKTNVCINGLETTLNSITNICDEYSTPFIHTKSTCANWIFSSFFVRFLFLSHPIHISINQHFSLTAFHPNTTAGRQYTWPPNTHTAYRNSLAYANRHTDKNTSHTIKTNTHKPPVVTTHTHKHTHTELRILQHIIADASTYTRGSRSFPYPWSSQSCCTFSAVRRQRKASPLYGLPSCCFVRRIVVSGITSLASANCCVQCRWRCIACGYAASIRHSLLAQRAEFVAAAVHTRQCSVCSDSVLGSRLLVLGSIVRVCVCVCLFVCLCEICCPISTSYVVRECR